MLRMLLYISLPLYLPLSLPHSPSCTLFSFLSLSLSLLTFSLPAVSAFDSRQLWDISIRVRRGPQRLTHSLDPLSLSWGSGAKTGRQAKWAWQPVDACCRVLSDRYSTAAVAAAAGAVKSFYWATNCEIKLWIKSCHHGQQRLRGGAKGGVASERQEREGGSRGNMRWGHVVNAALHFVSMGMRLRHRHRYCGLPAWGLRQCQLVAEYCFNAYQLPFSALSTPTYAPFVTAVAAVTVAALMLLVLLLLLWQ